MTAALSVFAMVPLWLVG